MVKTLCLALGVFLASSAFASPLPPATSNGTTINNWGPEPCDCPGGDFIGRPCPDDYCGPSPVVLPGGEPAHDRLKGPGDFDDALPLHPSHEPGSGPGEIPEDLQRDFGEPFVPQSGPISLPNDTSHLTTRLPVHEGHKNFWEIPLPPYEKYHECLNEAQPHYAFGAKCMTSDSPFITFKFQRAYQIWFPANFDVPKCDHSKHILAEIRGCPWTWTPQWKNRNDRHCIKDKAGKETCMDGTTVLFNMPLSTWSGVLHKPDDPKCAIDAVMKATGVDIAACKSVKWNSKGWMGKHQFGKFP